ncbi:hypothetical protein K3495_g1555, partial [Podosphaera aphanis]
MPNFQSSHHPPEGGTRSLSETLLLTTTAANTRAEEATLMFGGVAAAIDEATRGASAPKIPQPLMKTYHDFLTRLQLVAQEFFESHVRGYSPPIQSKKNGSNVPQLNIPGSLQAPHQVAPPVPKSTRPKSYANAVSKAKGNPGPNTVHKVNRPQVQAKAPTQVDERLFLRLSQDSNIRLLSPYPLLSLFRKLLGENAALLKEVQHVPSGLALRPSSEAASPKLESLLSEFISQGKIGGATGVEKAQNLVSYVITSVPRNYTTLNEYNQLTIEPIGADLVQKELSDEKGVSPVAVFETRGSVESPHMHSARYIARFPLGTTIPRKFQLFGVEVLAHQLSIKTNVVQCGRCYQWHNERICTRFQRCRLCGSTEHLEKDHQPCSTQPHTCPPRCLHCHGPHPADAPECPLRPRRNGSRLTKEQISQIRSTSAATRLSLCVTMGCNRRTPASQTDHEMTGSDLDLGPSSDPRSSDITSTDMPNLVSSSQNQLVLVPATPSLSSPMDAGNPYSINVGKGAVSHDLALAFAKEENFDVILIQEPYIFSDRQRRISKKISAYECFSPTNDWTKRPRVLTYLRKGVGDLLFLEITAPSGKKLTIVNVYNAPPGSNDEGEGVRALLSLSWGSSARERLLVAGDFNMRHPSWQPSTNITSPMAENLLEWTERNSLTLTSELDAPTHIRGNVLDLTFVSSSLTALGTETAISQELDATSDHFPIVTVIPWDSRYQEPVARLKPETLDEKLFLALLSSGIRGITDPAQTRTAEALDNYAQRICDTIKQAYSGSARRAMGKGTGQPWWNAECKAAAQTYRQTRRSSDNQDEIIAAKKALRTVTRRAKRKFFQDKLDKASSAKDVYGMVNWHRSAGSFRTPPLKDPLHPDAPLAITAESKRQVLAQNLLQRMPESGDIPMDTPAVGCKALPFPEISDQEIKAAVFRSGNTAPGEDDIPTSILKIGWDLIKDKISTLFRSCLEVGHHPACFKTAVVVMLSKPNKPDKSNPRSYRPISLLSVLGKSLERLVARRLSWIAITHKVIVTQQFGGLPLRSATDLTTCLTHDVETALNRNLTASLLTLDVKGAFDGVLPGRLVYRLREQGWPDHLVNWVASFATARQAKVRLDGTVGPAVGIPCGLPQGSPASPILFTLYLSPLFRLGNPSNRFGYADDVALLRISSSLQTNARLLSQDLQDALCWGNSEG